MKKPLAVIVAATTFAVGNMQVLAESAPPPPYKIFNMPADVAIPAGVRRYILSRDLSCEKERYKTDEGLSAWGCSYRSQWIAVYPKADGVICDRINTRRSHFKSECLVKFSRHIGAATDAGWLELRARSDGHWVFSGLWP